MTTDNLADAEKTMDQLLSEIVDHQQEGEFFSPLSVRLAPEQRRAQYVKLTKRLGPRYAKCTLASYEVYESMAQGRPSQVQVHEEVLQFAEDMPARLKEGGGVVLYGQPGTGKDHILVALAYEAVLRHGWVVEWTNGMDVAMKAREMIRTQESEAEFLKRYQAPQILLLSDPIPPKGEVSQYVADLIQRIIDRRYRNRKPTWATLNVHDGGEAEQRLASPIVDRLRHDSLALECNWPSYRARNGFTEAVR